MPYTIVDQALIFQGKVFALRSDTLQDEDGQRHQTDYVLHGGSVGMIPVDASGQVLLVRQYRHPVGEKLLEIPAGTLEEGESPLTCARRELREEVGMSPGELIPLGATYLAPGYSSEKLHYFLALDLRPAPLPADQDEDLQVARHPWPEIERWLTSFALEDAKSVVGLHRARRWLLANSPELLTRK